MQCHCHLRACCSSAEIFLAASRALYATISALRPFCSSDALASLNGSCGPHQCVPPARKAGELVVALGELRMLRGCFIEECLASRNKLLLVPLRAEHASGVVTMLVCELPLRHCEDEIVDDIAHGMLSNLEKPAACARVHRCLCVDREEVHIRLVQRLRGCHRVRLVLK
jgi:hypothetical protein